jgi:spermidine synthase
MLELIVFTSGGVLLALEIVASRVLAPVFGNSIYVWGSLIGVFLTALSVGYWVGGSLADRYPTRAAFCGLVFLAGLLTVPIPAVAPALLSALVAADLDSRTGPLVAALVLFFPASLVMGTISPYAVRLSARSVATVGGTAGRLYALSTLGSIAGCFAAAFWLISVMGVRDIILALGLVEMALAVVGLAGLRRVGAAGVAALVVAGAGVGVPRWVPGDGPEIRYARDTVYHRITVSDEGRVRYLKLDNYWQSALDLENPRRTVFRYADYMHVGMVFQPRPERVLVIGMGGGTVPKRYLEDYPEVRVDVVDIDPEVVEVAHRFFGVPRGGRLRAFAQDGRRFVQRAADRYDHVLLDAYLRDTLPFHLATREFYAEVRAKLNPGGVLVANVIGALEGPHSRLFRAVYRTLREVYPAVYVFPVDYGPVGWPEALRNIIVVATDRRWSPAEVQERARQVRGRVAVERFEAVVGDLYQRPIRTEDVPTLTDDYAPTDALLAAR